MACSLARTGELWLKFSAELFREESSSTVVKRIGGREEFRMQHPLRDTPPAPSSMPPRQASVIIPVSWKPVPETPSNSWIRVRGG